jgi:hypothetical protein
MFYTGVKWEEGAPPSAAQQRVGLAVSADLQNWKRWNAGGEDGLILDGPQHAEHPWSAYGIPELELDWEYDCRDPHVFDRGSDHAVERYVMLNSVRLAPYAQVMAIAYATSDDLVHWRWQHLFPVTIGEKAESAALLEHEGDFYLFWTASDHAPGVRVASSTSGIFGEYVRINDWRPLFGLASETLVEADRILYLAFDDTYTLHVKRDLLLPASPTPRSRVRITEFTACDDEALFRHLAP